MKDSMQAQKSTSCRNLLPECWKFVFNCNYAHKGMCFLHFNELQNSPVQNMQFNEMIMIALTYQVMSNSPYQGR